jgi:hypothetical protein
MTLPHRIKTISKAFVASVVCFSTLFAQKNRIDIQNKKDTDYIFFLHNKFLEESEIDAKHPEYGRAEYNEIINTFKNNKFVVCSEKRPASTDVNKYASKIITQINLLLKAGTQANHITVIGTSKGGYIAQIISSQLANPDINYVFVACFRETDLNGYPDINYCGNILTIYEKSDPNGVSAIQRKINSKLKINHFKEIELNTQLKHGFLFKALDVWLQPCMNWARRNYDS